ncbi:MAG: hypothetical protein H0Z37_00300 [Firmicutes bacterium]|nr:hypothetical protein [Bacillota bacterium]
MKVVVPGNPNLLGNTPEEIVDALKEMGFLASEGGGEDDDYLAHLERVVAERYGARAAGGSRAERAEQVVLALVDGGQLELLED